LIGKLFKRRLRAQHGYYTAADVTTDEGGIGGRRGSDRPSPSVIATDVNYMEFQDRSAAAADWPERMSYQALAGEMKESGYSTVKVSIFSLGVIPVPNSARFLDWKVKLLSNTRGRVSARSRQ